MRRRELITLLGGVAGGGVGAAAGNAGGRVSPQLIARRRAASRGCVPPGSEGGRLRRGPKRRDEICSAEDHLDRLPVLVAELMHRPVVVIVANAIAARVAKAATTMIPIVFASGGDPVKDGLVASLNRPGSNITGVVFFSETLGTKQLELLRQFRRRRRRYPASFSRWRMPPAMSLAMPMRSGQTSAMSAAMTWCGLGIRGLQDDFGPADQPLHLARQTKRTPPGGDWRGSKS